MLFRHPRQIPSGAITFSAVPAGTSNSLDIDPSHTGTAPGLIAPTLTVSSIAPPTTSTESSSIAPTSSTSAGASTSKFGVGAIIGLTVGIFVVLAIALVVFMSVRHKKSLQRGRVRAKSTARMSWTRLKDDQKPTQLQMRATSHAKTASIADATARKDNGPSLSPSSDAHRMHTETALPSRNPNFIAQGLSEHSSGVSVPPPPRSTDDTHIPNPFISPIGTPTHSPSTSHTSIQSSDAPHSLALAALSNFSQHTPQFAHASTITASSASEYPPEDNRSFDNPAYTVNPTKDEKSTVSPAQGHLSRKQSSRAAEESRSRELKAMQDLISALDERAQSKRAPPSAFNLNVDTNSSNGKSRLSMGEGLVTPGGHSIRDDDTAVNSLMYDENGSPYWAHDPLSSFDHQDFPLPPAEVFRAALSPSDNKGEGKSSNPFQG